MSTKRQENFRIRAPQSRFYFLPPILDFCELLRIKADPYHFVRELERETSVVSGVGKTSLYKITKDGVGSRIKNKLITFIQSAAPELSINISFKLLRQLFRAYRYKANAGGWLPVLAGFNNSRTSDQLDLLVNFCEQRALLELEFCRSAKQLPKSTPSATDQADYIADFLSQHTLIPNEIISDYVEAVDQYERTARMHHPKIIRFLIFAHADFFQSALAHYEVGLRLHLHNQGHAINWDRASFFSRAMPVFQSDERREKFAFNNLLEIFKNAPDGESDLTWRELATYIPINVKSSTDSVNEMSAEKDAVIDLNQRQYDTLKKWRRGKELPSTRLFSEFAACLIGPDTFDHQIICEQFRIALGIDNWCDHWQKHLASGEVEASEISSLLQEVLSHYSIHYQTVFSKLFNHKDKAA